MKCMAQRFGTVFALAIATAVFTAHGHLNTAAAAVTSGFQAPLWVCVGFACARRARKLAGAA